MLLLFGLALILNVSTSSAATVTTNHISPKVTAVNPANNAVILKSQTLKVTFNEIIKAGSSGIELKNGKNVISTKNSISGKTLSITPKTALTTGIKYKIILNPGSVTDLSGNSNKYYTSSFTVSPITLAQMKDGIYRAQKFYAANGRLPNTVHYGSNLIKIALENLLNNAWKFTSHHNTATIEFGSYIENNETVYYVKDDGAGFDIKYTD